MLAVRRRHPGRPRRAWSSWSAPAEGAGRRRARARGGSHAQPAGLYVARSETGVEAFALHSRVAGRPPGPRRSGGPAVLDAIDRRWPLRPGERVEHRPLPRQPRRGYQRDAMAVLAGSVSSLRRVAVPSRRPGRSSPLPQEDVLAAVLRVPRSERAGPGAVRRERADRVRVGPAAAAAGRVPRADRAARADRRDRPAAGRAAAAGAARPGRVRGRGPRGAARAEPAGPARAGARWPAPRSVPTCGRRWSTAIARLGDEPKGEPLRRVLDRTYLRPAPSQEAAAEVLGPAVQHVPALPRPGHRPPGRPAVGGRGRAPTEQHLAWWVSSATGRTVRGMAEILVLGAGLTGLTTAMLLARDGHDVTVLERDPAPAAGRARRRPGPAGTAPASPSSASCTCCCRAGGRDGRRAAARCSTALRAAGGRAAQHAAPRPGRRRPAGGSPGDERFDARDRPAGRCSRRRWRRRRGERPA